MRLSAGNAMRLSENTPRRPHAALGANAAVEPCGLGGAHHSGPTRLPRDTPLGAHAASEHRATEGALRLAVRVDGTRRPREPFGAALGVWKDATRRGGDPLSRNFPSGVALLPPVLNEGFSRADRDQALTFSRDCAPPNEVLDAPAHTPVRQRVVTTRCQLPLWATRWGRTAGYGACGGHTSACGRGGSIAREGPRGAVAIRGAVVPRGQRARWARPRNHGRGRRAQCGRASPPGSGSGGPRSLRLP